MDLLTGQEGFEMDGQPAGMTMLDFWRYKYSNVYAIHYEIAEFIVAKALGLDKPHNSEWWTLYDIRYRDCRIEIKETSYYHPWNIGGKVSAQRTFGISKANSAYENVESVNKFERQNDIYIFCLKTGNTREESDPLNLNNWIFRIVPTADIDKYCGNQKTVSLGRLQRLGFLPKRYDEIKAEIDRIVDGLSV